jgi:hypothetical protein
VRGTDKRRPAAEVTPRHTAMKFTSNVPKHSNHCHSPYPDKVALVDAGPSVETLAALTWERTEAERERVSRDATCRSHLHNDNAH